MKKCPATKGLQKLERISVVPLKLEPPDVWQTGDGEPCGLRTGAKALLCLFEDGKDVKGKREDEELELGTVGLDGMTGKKRQNTYLIVKIHSVFFNRRIIKNDRKKGAKDLSKTEMI